MSAIVGIDAAVWIKEDTSTVPTTTPYYVPATSGCGSWANSSGWSLLSERNEVSISISVDVAEHRPFVACLEEAWVGKARTWMNWSGSLSGYYDDADDTIFNTMKEGAEVWMLFFDSRASAEAASPKYWFGKTLLTTVDHTTGSEDFSTLDCDFEGTGVLYRSALS